MTEIPYRDGRVRIETDPLIDVPDVIKLPPLAFIKQEKDRLGAEIPPEEYRELAAQQKIRPPPTWRRYLYALIPAAGIFLYEVCEGGISTRYPFLASWLAFIDSLVCIGALALWHRKYSPAAKAYKAWLDAGERWNRNSSWHEYQSWKAYPYEANQVGKRDYFRLPKYYAEAIDDLIQQKYGSRFHHATKIFLYTNEGLYWHTSSLRVRIAHLDTVDKDHRHRVPQLISQDQNSLTPEEQALVTRYRYREALVSRCAAWERVSANIIEARSTLLARATAVADMVHIYGALNASPEEEEQIFTTWKPLFDGYLVLKRYLESLSFDREDSVPTEAQRRGVFEVATQQPVAAAAPVAKKDNPNVHRGEPRANRRDK